jgi:methionyl-tRNA formyltransferase
LKELKDLSADLFVVVAFRMLPEVVWSMPPKGSINLHGSLLPQYRGAAPIHRAVMNGETKTGVSTFFLQHEIDTGKIILQREMPVGPDESTGEVHDRMMVLGAQTLVETLDLIEKGDVSCIDQQSLLTSEIHHAPKIFKEDCLISWEMPAIQITSLYTRPLALSMCLYDAWRKDPENFSRAGLRKRQRKPRYDSNGW